MTFDVSNRKHGISISLLFTAVVYAISVSSTGAPFQVFAIATLFAAWFGGFPAGIVVTLLAAAIGSSIDGIPPLRTFLYMCEGIGITFLVAALRQARTVASENRKIASHYEGHFRLLVETASDAIVAFNTKGKILFCNQAFTRLLGYNAEELMALEVAMLVPASNYPKFLDAMELYINGKRHTPEWLDKEASLLHKDGRAVPVEIAFGVYAGQDDEVVFTGFLRDISSRKYAEFEKQIAYDEAITAKAHAESASRALRVANMAKDEFLAIIGHELRTPMTSIIGWVQIILRQLEQEELDKDFLLTGLQNIEASSKAQAQLVNDMLDMSRIRLGKLVVERHMVDLNEIVTTVVNRTILPAASAKGLKINIKSDPAVGFVNLDPNRFQQVLWNLLSNSVKFTDTGAISVETKKVGNAVHIEVADTGIGIEAGELHKVFQKFRSSHNALNHTSGLGLGLTISQELVHAHGGQIAAHSDGLGKGCRFIITLPS